MLSMESITTPILVTLILTIGGGAWASVWKIYHNLEETKRIKHRLNELPCMEQLASIEKIGRRLDQIETSISSLVEQDQKTRDEGTVMLKGILAVCDGLIQQGCNGEVTHCHKAISDYLVEKR